MKHRQAGVTIVIAAALMAQAGIARADESALDLIKRGDKALKEKRFREACDAFDASNKLQPEIETELKLADCYEKDAKPATAARLYRALADKDPKAARKKTSAAKAAKLEAKAPKLRITTDPKQQGVAFKVNGIDVPATGDIPVDIGPQEIVASAPGFEGRANAITEKDKVVVKVVVTMVVSEPPKPDPTPDPKPDPVPDPKPDPKPDPTTEPDGGEPMPPAMERPPTIESSGGGHRRRNGAIIGAVGVGALIGGVVFYVASVNKFDERDEQCPTGMCQTDEAFDRATALRSDARTLRGVSYGMGIGGVVLVGVGTYLMLTPNKHAARVSIRSSAGTTAITYTGSF